MCVCEGGREAYLRQCACAREDGPGGQRLTLLPTALDIGTRGLEHGDRARGQVHEAHLVRGRQVAIEAADTSVRIIILA